MLYKKIDLYLEKISKLDSREKYQLLDILINKYGRDYIESNEPKENPLTVYCKFGNKVMCCYCDKRLCAIHKLEDNFDMYVAIAKHSNNALPLDIIQNDIFRQFRIKKKKFPKRFSYHL